MIKLFWKILKDEQGATLNVTYDFSPNTLISSSQVNQNFTDVETVVNALTAANYTDDSVTAVKLNADVVRAGYGLFQHTDGSLYVDVSDTNPCLEITDGGVRAKVDDSSIERASGGLQVKALGITNAMLAGSIADSKLSQLTTTDKVANSALVQITTASKVSGAAITGLASVPSGAGVLPIANGGTGVALVQRGRATLSNGGTVTFPTSFGDTNYTLIITVDSGGTGIVWSIQSSSATGFTFYTNGGGSYTVHWLAIDDV